MHAHSFPPRGRLQGSANRSLYIEPSSLICCFFFLLSCRRLQKAPWTNSWDGTATIRWSSESRRPTRSETTESGVNMCLCWKVRAGVTRPPPEQGRRQFTLPDRLCWFPRRHWVTVHICSTRSPVDAASRVSFIQRCLLFPVFTPLSLLWLYRVHPGRFAVSYHLPFHSRKLIAKAQTPGHQGQ